MIELRAGPARAVVVPATGGRLVSIDVAGTELLVRRLGAGDPPMLSGSFPMAPYAGRVAGAQFTFDTVTHVLPATLPPHAGHGTVHDRRWSRTDDGRDPAAAALRCDLGPAWPLGGHAEQELTVTPTALHWTLAVVAGGRSMPAELGWHTFFATNEPITFAPTGMYERAGALPTGRLVTPRPPPWDDCFVGVERVGLRVGPLVVEVTSDAECLVVFDALDRGTAVEPQSGPPDAFHLAPRRLAPGERLERHMTIGWQLPS